MSASQLDFTVDGKNVTQICLTDGTLDVTLLSVGCALQDLRLSGVPHSLTIGSPVAAQYASTPFSAGVLVGPVGNRISGATATLGQNSYHFDPNGRGGHCLHGGAAGIHRKVWDVLDHDDQSVTFAVSLADGEGGFPGNRQMKARFSLTAPGCLEMNITAETDAQTWINPANHSYWNLDGTPTYEGHVLTLAADRACCADEDSMVTGEVRDVTGTDMDFRQPRQLSAQTGPELDHNFCLSDAPTATPRRVLRLTGQSGVSMQMHTTEPGMQVFDGRILGGDGFTRHDGIPLEPFAGIALEAQGWPDSPNQPKFPSVVVQPGTPYRQITRWTFSH